MEVEIVFDGGSIRNPGDGYGSYSLRIGGAAPRIGRLVFGHATSNEAEYLALIGALEDAIRSLERAEGSPAVARLTVRGDSRLVLEQVRGRWKVRAAHLLGLRDRAVALLERFGAVELLWQPRSATVKVLGH